MIEDRERLTLALGEAMELALAHVKRGFEVEHKDNGSLVTACDRDIDALLRERLPRGDDGWLSEESEDDGSRAGRARVWIVDPIDGTRAFSERREDYSISIALLVDGEPVLGGIGAPAYGMTVIGGPGHGLRVQGEPNWQWPAGIPRPRIVASRSEVKRGEWRHVQEQVEVRRCGSVALNLALVAAGFADATWTRQPKNEWDVAAGTALIRAAGGEVWLPRGGHMQWNRAKPRFLSFAAAQPGLRRHCEELMLAGDGVP